MLVLTVDPKDMGQATAMNNVFRNLGGSVGAPIVGSLLASYVTTVVIAGAYAPKLLAFQYAFWIAAAITLIGGIAVLFGEEVLGPRRHAKFAHHPQPAGVPLPSRPTPAEPIPMPSAAPSGAGAPGQPGVRMTLLWQARPMPTRPGGAGDPLRDVDGKPSHSDEARRSPAVRSAGHSAHRTWR